MPKSLTLDIDLSMLHDLSDSLNKNFENKINYAISLLTAQVHTHIIEEAQTRLQSSKTLYLDNLSQPEQIDNVVWVITLFDKAVWIDDGRGAFDLKQVMLNSPKAKQGKNGKYIIVPFKHSKPAAQRTQTDKVLVETLKRELKRRGGFFKKIETDTQGRPLLGKIHSFNISVPRQAHMLGLGQQGPQGRPFSANPRPPGQAGPRGRPFLHGVRVYQHEAKNPLGQTYIKKDIFTFRTISENSAPGSWQHPGTRGVHIFEESYDWAQNIWDRMEDELIKEIIG